MSNSKVYCCVGWFVFSMLAIYYEQKLIVPRVVG